MGSWILEADDALWHSKLPTAGAEELNVRLG